jgi:formylglycine-generating enzyme required for sulfatase activity
MDATTYVPGELVVTEGLGVGPGVPTPVRSDWSYIPPGTFLMCSPDTDDDADEDEKPQHEVRLTRGFLMHRTPVTQEQWRAVIGTDPSWFKGRLRPVERVSWLDAVAYCNALSAVEGLPAAYLISSDLSLVRPSINRTGYRLPTEAEWEYACRAGTMTPRWGELDHIAWYGDNSGNETHPVGKKYPNSWNLYDMLGNVSEWTQDWYGRYSVGRQTDPQGPPSGSSRVYRGGAWVNGSWVVRSSFRSYGSPVDRASDLGFRPVRSIP